MLEQGQKDYLAELVNIGIGQSAASLSEMVGAKVHLKIPDVDVYPMTALHTQLAKLGGPKLSAVRQGFDGSLSGEAYLIFSFESAKGLAEKLMEEQIPTEQAEMQIEEVITEVGNIVINSFLGLWSHIFPNHLEYEVPVYLLETPDKIFEGSRADEKNELPGIVVSANTTFHIKDIEVMGTIMVLFEVSSVEGLIGAIDRSAVPTAR
ncbi:MAG: chemotaxis protein CheX [Candidatus Zixiibacteriota bacterium]